MKGNITTFKIDAYPIQQKLKHQPESVSFADCIHDVGLLSLVCRSWMLWTVLLSVNCFHDVIVVLYCSIFCVTFPLAVCLRVCYECSAAQWLPNRLESFHRRFVSGCVVDALLWYFVSVCLRCFVFCCVFHVCYVLVVLLCSWFWLLFCFVAFVLLLYCSMLRFLRLVLADLLKQLILIVEIMNDNTTTRFDSTMPFWKFKSR